MYWWELVQDFASAYLDDLIIHSNSWKENVSHLGRGLQKLRKAGLTVKPKKCQFAKSHKSMSATSRTDTFRLPC